MDWRLATVAPDGTHHLVDGQPLYERRFLEVLKFHAPGLAPARDGTGAFHIDPAGRPAYSVRHDRTFGFYEGLAAVATSSGWFHIRPDGAPAHDARWAWCGNFQEGRAPARGEDGRYRHVDRDGQVVGTKWRYAGDYRDGVAVVQADDGRSTHVDANGGLLHGRWFVDLDVFHKGYARARDEAGWMHVTKDGRPAYARRFAMVEPFYNGQARVERSDGALEIVNESGARVVELRPAAAARDVFAEISADLVSWRSDVLHVAVAVGVFDDLPMEAHEHLAEPLRRLLAALGEMGMVEVENGRWVATTRGTLLRRDHPLSLAPAARYWAGDGREPWRSLAHALRDPTWRPVDPFARQADEPDRVRAYHDAIAPYARHDYATFPHALENGHAVLLDAGGGSGALAEAVLGVHENMTAVVLDRPEVVRQALIPARFAERLTFVPGDLFQPWPVTADAIVLARILHDWADEDAAAILQRARQALQPGGRLYVVEMVRPARGFGGALLDLHMLLATGGRERTEAMFHTLLERAGLRLADIRPMPSVSSVIVAVPA